MTDRMQTRFKVIDNSGAKEVGLIAVKTGRRPHIGSFVTVSVKKINPHSKVKRGDVLKGIVVRTRMAFRRADGTTISFNENAIIVLNRETLKNIGTRLFGPVPREIKKIMPSISSMIPTLV